MWRGLMLTKAVEQFLRDVHWGELDDLLIDMPPGTGDVQMGLARLLPRADMVIVTTPALAAQKVAQRAADMARRSFVRVVGVIENMTDFTCEHGGTYPLFGAGGGAALAGGDRRPAARVRCRSSRRSPPAATPVARWRWRPARMPARRRRRSSEIAARAGRPSCRRRRSHRTARTWPAARPACWPPSRSPSTPPSEPADASPSECFSRSECLAWRCLRSGPSDGVKALGWIRCRQA